MSLDPVSAANAADRYIRSLVWWIGYCEGYIEGGRTILLIQGRKRFGAPPADREAALAAITDWARLERMAEYILDATGWDDLLARP